MPHRRGGALGAAVADHLGQRSVRAGRRRHAGRDGLVGGSERVCVSICTTCNGYRWIDDRGSPCCGQPFFSAEPCADCNAEGAKQLWGQEPGDPGYKLPPEPAPITIASTVEQLQVWLEAGALREKLLLATLDDKDKQCSEYLGALSRAEAALEPLQRFETEVRAAYDAEQTTEGACYDGVYDAILLLDGSRDKWYGVSLRPGMGDVVRRHEEEVSGGDGPTPVGPKDQE